MNKFLKGLLVFVMLILFANMFHCEAVAQDSAPPSFWELSKSEEPIKSLNYTVYSIDELKPFEGRSRLMEALPRIYTVEIQNKSGLPTFYNVSEYSIDTPVGKTVNLQWFKIPMSYK